MTRERNRHMINMKFSFSCTSSEKNSLGWNVARWSSLLRGFNLKINRNPQSFVWFIFLWPLFILKPIQVQFVAILFTFVANAPILCPFANANGSHFHFSLCGELNYWKKHMTGIQLLVPFGSWPPKGLAPFTYTIKLWKICGLWPSRSNRLGIQLSYP